MYHCVPIYQLTPYRFLHFTCRNYTFVYSISMSDAYSDKNMTTREVLARLPSVFSVDDVRRVSQWEDSRVWVETRRWVQRGRAAHPSRGFYSLYVIGPSYPHDLVEALP